MKYDIWTVTTDINPVTVIDHLFIQLSWHVNIGVARYYTILVLSFLKGMSYDAFLAILDSAVVVCFCLVVFGWRSFRALYKNTPWVTSRESECIENWADTIQLQVVVLESDRSDQFQTMAQHSRDSESHGESDGYGTVDHWVAYCPRVLGFIFIWRINLVNLSGAGWLDSHVCPLIHRNATDSLALRTTRLDKSIRAYPSVSKIQNHCCMRGYLSIFRVLFRMYRHYRWSRTGVV